MMYNIFKKYVRRVCIHKNNTINSQYNWLDYRTKLFGEQMKKVSDKFWGLQSRDGRGMKGRLVSASTLASRNGIIINPNNAPPRKAWLQKLRESYILISNITNIFTTKTIHDKHIRWFRYNSFLRLRKKNETESDYRV